MSNQTINERTNDEELSEPQDETSAADPMSAAEPADSDKLDLSLTQTVGGALAAMTAAALGSRLGVLGTIGGAAVASVVAGVAGSLYTASLRRTRTKVKTVLSGRAPEVTPARAASGRQGSPGSHRPVRRSTQARRSTLWQTALVGAFAAFAVAAVALTGFELLSGSALSGGRGTTIEQVSKHTEAKSGSDSTPKPTKPSASPSSTTPSAVTTEEPTPATSQAPETAEPSADPSEAPSASEPPSPAPSDLGSESTENESPGPTPGG